MSPHHAWIFFSLFNLIISFNLSSPHYISTDQCSVIFPTLNTSFNVCNLKLPNGFGQRDYYVVRDYRYDIPSESGHYYYHFNIGAPVLTQDTECLNITSDGGYCTNITDSGVCASDLTPITGTSYAYQLRNDTTTNTIDACWRLSNEYGGPPEWSLTYAANPTEGVTLSYVNGDFLHSGACPRNRQFNIAFLCENEFLNVPDEEPLHESDICDYTLQIKSIYGCPIECKIYDRALCNNEGLCGYDFSNMKPRCFCYHNFDGDDCSIFDNTQNVSASSKQIPIQSADNIVYTFTEVETNGNVINVTYDLTPMALNGMAYNITDKNRNRPYMYFVGILQPINLSIAQVPKECLNFTTEALPCTVIDENGSCSGFGNDSDYRLHTYAYQYDPTDGWCATIGTTYQWKLYDEIDDPARGITIDYEGGTWCESRGINRGLRVSLVCPDDQEEFHVPDINEEAFVEEDTEAYCEYSMEIPTTIACPYQCRTSKYVDGNIEYSVCSEHGICVVDPNAGFVRCLCDDGWTGVECAAIESPKPTQYPTISPTHDPTLRPTRYPTMRVRIHNVTVVGRQSGGTKTGGFTTIIIILVLVLIVFCVVGYYVIKRFKQREAVLQMKLDEYKVMGNDERHDINTNKRGISAFTTIDDHIANDKDENAYE